MKLAYKLGIALLLVALVNISTQAENRQEFTKTVKKEFDISRDGNASLNNMYGKIDVKTWDRDRVKIEVNIIVRANSESKAQETFDRIDINFSNGRDFVNAETAISSKKTKWWDWGDSKCDYTINYEVYLPPSNALDITNKYGDVYVAEMNNHLKIKVKYGNFKLDGVSDDVDVVLDYGNGDIVKSGDLNTMIKYSSLHVEEAKDIEIESKYSKLTLDQVGDIRCITKYDSYKMGYVEDFRNEGKYDNIEIDKADNIRIVSQYTQVSVGGIMNSLDLEMKHGVAKIGKVAKGFSDVNLVGKYTDFKVGVEDGASFRMEAFAEYAGIRYPEGMVITLEKEKGTSHEVNGHVGSQSSQSVLKAHLDYGGLKVWKL
ncbi:MAG: hypothetical protein GY705_19665 [Bacteroidetes bacterium]|nr:hypothetical protein [Bacteroidota bacterium]